MEPDRARYLVSHRGRQALAATPREAAALAPHRLADLLRRDHPPAESSALAEQVTLCARAEARLGGPSLSLFTAAGLEMMTHPAVAHRRAVRLATAGLPLLDLTCGIGGDLAALAATGQRTTGLEHDRATALIARANVPGADIVQGDAVHPPFRFGQAAVLIDPSRRGAAGRTWDPSAFSPPWDAAVALANDATVGVVKAPPGIDLRHLPPEAEVERVQYGRSMRETAVWLGAGTVAGLRRAVLLPAGLELTSAEPAASATTRPIGAVVIDPESCVTLAGLVRHLAHRLDAWMLDPQVAYLSASTAVATPLAAAFEVLEVVPFSVSRLRGILREEGWSPDEVRRRAFPVEPDELRRLLGPLKGEPVTLLCTTITGRRTVIVGRRVLPPP